MKTIINGYTYNTDTADFVCELSSACGKSDFRWHETDLYRTKKGTFFIAGKGGPLSMWAKSHDNGWSEGSGLRVISAEEARSYMESNGCAEEVFEEFGLPLLQG